MVTETDLRNTERRECTRKREVGNNNKIMFRLPNFMPLWVLKPDVLCILVGGRGRGRGGGRQKRKWSGSERSPFSTVVKVGVGVGLSIIFIFD